jgi:hypothetical protein
VREDCDSGGGSWRSLEGRGLCRRGSYSHIYAKLRVSDVTNTDGVGGRGAPEKVLDKGHGRVFARVCACSQ